MSRYLDYAQPTVTNGVKTIETPPGKLKALLGCILGPEERFREYLVEPGKYRGLSTPLCGARVVLGPAQKEFPVAGRNVKIWVNTTSTFVMTLVPGLLYFYGVLPRHLAYQGLTISESFVGVTQSIFGISIIVSFLLASFMNPGIIPRNARKPKGLDEDLRGNPTARFLRINGITIKQKFCTTCNIFRPPRSKHCSFCDNCVLRFDHHCTWLGNCVGLHNYRFYVCLIYSATIFLIETIYVVVSLMHELAVHGPSTDFNDQCYQLFVAHGVLGACLFVLFFYCVFLLGAVLLLSIYHTVISMQNLTTNEHVKNYYRENPFDFGGFYNCRQIYCFPERVIAKGDDQIEVDYVPFGSYSDGLSFDDA